MTTAKAIAGRGCVLCLFLGAALGVAQQQQQFDGTWQMDTAKSHVNDGRTVTVVIASTEKAVAFKMKTKKGEVEATGEFTATLNGKACEYMEGSHTSKVTAWFEGSTLNFCKENGPPEDVTSMWKLELSPDKQTLTMKIAHYEPAAADETIVFTKAQAPTP